MRLWPDLSYTFKTLEKHRRRCRIEGWQSNKHPFERKSVLGRGVGYLANNDFMAALKNGLGRIAFVHKKYADAERWYGDVVAQYGDSHFAPEAMYWRAVAQYSPTHDHTVLGKVAEELRSKYPSSLWTSKAIPWLH